MHPHEKKKPEVKQGQFARQRAVFTLVSLYLFTGTLISGQTDLLERYQLFKRRQTIFWAKKPCLGNNQRPVRA
jgi:hypothetical protein